MAGESLDMHAPVKQELPLVRVGIPSAFRRREDVNSSESDWEQQRPILERRLQALQPKESSVFREVAEMLTNPETAKQTAEVWNTSDMPWEIDMDDPDAPWNEKK